MARSDEDRELAYYIPQNFKETNVTSSGTPIRNMIEAGVLAMLVGGIMLVVLRLFSASFTITVVLETVSVGLVFFVTMRGFRGYSISEYFANKLKFMLRPKNYIRKDNLFVKHEDN